MRQGPDRVNSVPTAADADLRATKGEGMETGFVHSILSPLMQALSLHGAQETARPAAAAVLTRMAIAASQTARGANDGCSTGRRSMRWRRVDDDARGERRLILSAKLWCDMSEGPDPPRQSRVAAFSGHEKSRSHAHRPGEFIIDINDELPGAPLLASGRDLVRLLLAFQGPVEQRRPRRSRVASARLGSPARAARRETRSS